MLAALVALGVVTLVAVGGCQESAHEEPVAHQVIRRDTAARVLKDYTARLDEATTQRRQDLLDTVVSGPNAPIQAGRLKIDAYYAKKNPGATARASAELSRPSFWIPRLTGTAQWFAVFAVQPVTGNRVLLVFARPDARHRFTAAYRVALRPRTKLPQVRASSHGGVRVAAAQDNRLVVRPDALAELHARIEQYGASTSGAAHVEPSEWTTAPHATLSKDIRAAEKKGFSYRRTYHPSGYPTYALLTATGGALVWYSVADELSVHRTDRSAHRPLKLSHAMGGIIGTRKAHASFQVASVREYVAYVPPRGKGKVRLIGATGGPVGGIGR